MNNPTFGYRRVAGVLEAKVFDGEIPQGWVDTPAKCQNDEAKAEPAAPVAETPQPKPRAKRTRKPKADG
jgi:hypothetical protein